MKVLVVSGFLGAGKTTFIKELIRKTKKQLVVLENEYGETDLDSKDISSSSGEPLKMLEFMEGCVCCSKKDTFANSLIAISASLDPEYLVVEPTGVGKLGNILANVQKVTWDKIHLMKPVVVVAPRSYASNMSEYGEIYEDQIRYASYVVFSKIENEDPAVIASVKQQILQLNPQAEILDTPYPEVDASWFDRLIEAEEAAAVELDENDSNENLDQYTLKFVRMHSVSDLVLLMEDGLHGKLGQLARMKGIIQCEDSWFRFDMADGLYTISGYEEEDPRTQCVFIGASIDREAIQRYFSELEQRKIRSQARVNQLFRKGTENMPRKQGF